MILQGFHNKGSNSHKPPVQLFAQQHQHGWSYCVCVVVESTELVQRQLDIWIRHVLQGYHRRFVECLTTGVAFVPP